MYNPEGKKTVCCLYRLVKEGNVEVRVDGPYGEDSERPKWAGHKVLVILAGGIGVRLDHDIAVCVRCLADTSKPARAHPFTAVQLPGLGSLAWRVR